MRQKFNESELSEKQEIELELEFAFASELGHHHLVRQQQQDQQRLGEKMSGKMTTRVEQQQPAPFAPQQQQQQQQDTAALSATAKSGNIKQQLKNQPQVSARPAGSIESAQQQPANQSQNQNQKRKQPNSLAAQQGGSKKPRKTTTTTTTAASAANGNSAAAGTGEKRAKMQGHQHQQHTELLGAAAVATAKTTVNNSSCGRIEDELATGKAPNGQSNVNNAATFGEQMLGPLKENICAACLKPIKERYLLVALNKQWHEDCLKCDCCDCRLGEVGSTLYEHADKMLCRRDFLRIFGQHGHCAACKKPIPPYELVMRANENAYHMDCFACQQCQYRFCVGDRFHLTDSHRIVCIMCHTDARQRQQHTLHPAAAPHNQHPHAGAAAATHHHPPPHQQQQHHPHHHNDQQHRLLRPHLQRQQPGHTHRSPSPHQAQAAPFLVNQAPPASAEQQQQFATVATTCEQQQQLDTRLATSQASAELELVSPQLAVLSSASQQQTGELAGFQLSGGSTKSVQQQQPDQTAAAAEANRPAAAFTAETGPIPQQSLKQQRQQQQQQQQTAACAM